MCCVFCAETGARTRSTVNNWLTSFQVFNVDNYTGDIYRLVGNVSENMYTS